MGRLQERCELINKRTLRKFLHKLIPFENNKFARNIH